MTGTLTLTGNTNTLQTVPASQFSATVEGALSQAPAPSAPFVVQWADIVGKPTFGTAASRDAPAAGNANTAQVVLGSDTRLTDSRTTTAAGITDSTATGRALVTAVSPTTARGTLGSSVVGDALFTAPDQLSGRNTLGLGTISTQNANAVAITGGSESGLTRTGGSLSGLATDLAIADGGTGASTAAAARTNLGLSGLAVANPALGQCNLVFTSTTALTLLPLNGIYLFINGTFCTIPIAGVTSPTPAAASLAASTLYYAYATQSGGVVNAIEFSTTAPATDATYGNRIKTGDANRVLLAVIRTNASTQFADNASQRFVCNWYNRKLKSLYNALASGSTAAGSFTELSASNRAEFVGFNGDSVQIIGTGTLANSSIATCSSAVYFDGTAGNSTSCSFTAAGSGYNGSMGASNHLDLAADGYHYCSIFGATAGGTMSAVSASVRGQVLA